MAPSMKAMLAVALLALAASFADASRLKTTHRAAARSLLQAQNSSGGPSPCWWDETGATALQWDGFCGFNPAFLVTLTGVAPLANVTIQGIKYSLACAMHNVSSGSPADIATCVNDKANFCFLDGEPGSWYCNSAGTDGAFVTANVTCPGSVYQAYENCITTYQDSCNGSCVWRPDLQTGYAAYQNYSNLTGGAYQTLGWCYPSIVANFTLAQFREWNDALSPPADSPDYITIRGNCSYAIGGKARFAYDALCDSFNQDASYGLMLGNIYDNGTAAFTGLNVTAATMCLNAGCSLDNIPGDIYYGYGPGEDWFQCSPDVLKRYSLGYFSPEDHLLNEAAVLCSNPANRWNQANCEAQVLF